MIGCGPSGCNCGTGLHGFGKTPSIQDQVTNVQNAGYVVQAPASGDILDAFGSQYRNYVLIGGAALGIALLVKLIK